jgi:hypothetical protein
VVVVGGGGGVPLRVTISGEEGDGRVRNEGGTEERREE